MIGSMRLCAKHKVPAPTITLATAAAMLFRAVDERGQAFPPDQRFVEQLQRSAPEQVLRSVCELEASVPDETLITRNVLAAHRFIAEQRQRALPWVGRFRLPAGR